MPSMNDANPHLPHHQCGLGVECEENHFHTTTLLGGVGVVRVGIMATTRGVDGGRRNFRLVESPDRRSPTTRNAADFSERSETMAKRGAPFGNQNAVTHGLFSRAVREQRLAETAERRRRSAEWEAAQPQVDYAKHLAEIEQWKRNNP